eukprot:1584238-Pleurochrysis_carterae.AAC.1
MRASAIPIATEGRAVANACNRLFTDACPRRRVRATRDDALSLRESASSLRERERVLIYVVAPYDQCACLSPARAPTRLPLRFLKTHESRGSAA